ncbi:anti-sigma-I factor RsgI family protein [Virgibacillus sp. MG-45]|uniref:anti-sigma-I factor RsgI family protein n=1 Tax=Virgibacillus sp. MG-45 TaxID=3102791 RepID=UPI002EDB867C
MKTKQYDGIVVKVTSTDIVLLCSDGQFKNVPRAKNDVPRIGQAYTYTEKRQMPFYRTTKILTAIAIIFISLVAYTMLDTMKKDEAYVFALDINPSLEIYTDKDFQVMRVKSLNKNASAVVEGIKNKNKALYEYLDEVVTNSVKKHYLSKEHNNRIAITVVSLGKDEHSLPSEKVLEQKVQQSLKAHAIASVVTIRKGNKNLLEEARNVNLSLNKYQVYDELNKLGVRVSVKDSREKSISTILNENKQNIKEAVKRNKSKKPTTNAPATPKKEKSYTNDEKKDREPVQDKSEQRTDDDDNNEEDRQELIDEKKEREKERREEQAEREKERQEKLAEEREKKREKQNELEEKEREKQEEMKEKEQEKEEAEED